MIAACCSLLNKNLIINGFRERNAVFSNASLNRFIDAFVFLLFTTTVGEQTSNTHSKVVSVRLSVFFTS